MHIGLCKIPGIAPTDELDELYGATQDRRTLFPGIPFLKAFEGGRALDILIHLIPVCHYFSELSELLLPVSL
jgi:hypothetical protein